MKIPDICCSLLFRKMNLLMHHLKKVLSPKLVYLHMPGAYEQRGSITKLNGTELHALL